jgi:predicted site-specific integrase-resolvase
MPNETPVYDLKALSDKLNISIRTLREYIKRGDLEARKIGRAYYVTEPNLLAFLGPKS